MSPTVKNARNENDLQDITIGQLERAGNKLIAREYDVVEGRTDLGVGDLVFRCVYAGFI
jgi:hypothetical protein